MLNVEAILLSKLDSLNLLIVKCSSEDQTNNSDAKIPHSTQVIVSHSECRNYSTCASVMWILFSSLLLVLVNTALCGELTGVESIQLSRL